MDKDYRKEFKIVYPVIRGKQEKYVEVLAEDDCVKPLEFLKQYLLNKYPR